MRLADVPSRAHAWDDLNRQALACSMDGQRTAEMFGLLSQIDARWPDCWADLAAQWIDTVSAAQGITEYGPAANLTTGIDFTTVEQLASPRTMTDAEVWACDLIRARMTWDLQAYLDLFSRATGDGLLGQYLPVLLRLVGYNLARVRDGL